MEKMLIVLPNDSMGGAEQILFELCRYQSCEKKIKVIFLKKEQTGYWSNNLDSDNIDLLYLKSDSEKKGLFNLVLWAFRTKDKFDYALTSQVHLNGIIGFFNKIKLLKIRKHIARESTYIFDRFSGLKLREFIFFYSIGYYNIDLLITQTNDMKVKLLSSLRRRQTPKKVITIPNLTNYSDIRKKSIAYKPNQNKYIVSAGRLIIEKGFDNLIESFSLILNEIEGYTLVILGEGNERKKLEELIAELKLEGKVQLLGYFNNPMPYFKHAELCVVSSRIEGFPNVLLQMMGLNGNVLSTLCAGGIDNLEGVQTCEADNLQALSNALLRSIKTKNDNSRLFQKELETRSVENYWKQIEICLHEA